MVVLVNFRITAPSFQDGWFPLAPNVLGFCVGLAVLVLSRIFSKWERLFGAIGLAGACGGLVLQGVSGR